MQQPALRPSENSTKTPTATRILSLLAVIVTPALWSSELPVPVPVPFPVIVVGLSTPALALSSACTFCGNSCSSAAGWFSTFPDPTMTKVPFDGNPNVYRDKQGRDGK
ncbi:hypothetical protein K435DRAFT_783383 [Dendrothele bispora CBS 962.96]|uniref:Uncharacterized protein n=1 Tax=Dendrothele bispora (strain CBS 962.96) TaxID=1314807 RepID=A0A4S8L9M0_DENBC|nr:hypothetical protein K435DRAFT_783383 [Dendrothele bispora CBS 962.96]